MEKVKDGLLCQCLNWEYYVNFANRDLIFIYVIPYSTIPNF